MKYLKEWCILEIRWRFSWTESPKESMLVQDLAQTDCAGPVSYCHLTFYIRHRIPSSSRWNNQSHFTPTLAHDAVAAAVVDKSRQICNHWCCFYYFVSNSTVIFLAALCGYGTWMPKNLIQMWEFMNNITFTRGYRRRPLRGWSSRKTCDICGEYIKIFR